MLHFDYFLHFFQSIWNLVEMKYQLFHNENPNRLVPHQKYYSWNFQATHQQFQLFLF